MASFTNLQNVKNNNNGGDVNNLQRQNNIPTYNDGVDIDENARLQWTPNEFSILFNETRKSSIELAADITSKFKQTFHDIAGSFIYCDRGVIRIRLFFEYNNNPLPEGKIHSIVDLTEPSTVYTNDFYNKNQVVQNKINGKKFTLNKATRILLSEFVYGGKEANKSNSNKWDKMIKECPVEVSTMQAPYPIYRPNNAHRIFLAIDAIDINKILQKLYGDIMVSSTKFNSSSEAVSKTSKCKYKTRYLEPGTRTNEIMIGIGVINIEGIEEKFYKEHNNFNTSFLQMY